MNFIRDYLKFCENSEAHLNYQFWCALWTLSTIVGRRVWLDQGHYVVYPNLYIVLVGPPGNRKTSAKSIAHDLVRRVVREGAPVPMSGESVTREKFIQDLAADESKVTFMDHSKGKPIPREFQQQSLCITELSGIVGPSQAAMVETLTALYDVGAWYEYKTKHQGSDEIPNPYVSLLACTTPDYITSKLKDDIISGGFSRRALFILEHGKKKRIAFPTISAEQKEAIRNAARLGLRAQSVGGAMSWEPRAKVWFGDWYENTLKSSNDMNMAGYYDTKHVILLKISILLALSDNLRMELRYEDLQMGLELLRPVEETMPEVFAAMGRNELKNIAYKALKWLRMTGDVPVSGVRNYLFADCRDERELESVLRHLKAMNLIEFFEVAITKDGKPTGLFASRVRATRSTQTD